MFRGRHKFTGMGRMAIPQLSARGTMAVMLLAGLITVSEALADDLTTLAGVVYHDVRPVRVDPDGVTWQYDEGIAKIDFTDSPKKICQDYHYDPAKAAAYRASLAQARQQANEQSRQILQQDAQRRAARAQTTTALGEAQKPAEMKLVYQRAASPAASEATRALGAQMESVAAAKAVQPTGIFGAVARSPVAPILSMLGVNFYQGPSVLNEDPLVPNRREYQAGAHHSPSSGFAVDAARDSFYTPDYTTKSYFEDVDRSAALLRDVPLKP